MMLLKYLQVLNLSSRFFFDNASVFLAVTSQLAFLAVDRYNFMSSNVMDSVHVMKAVHLPWVLSPGPPPIMEDVLTFGHVDWRHIVTLPLCHIDTLLHKLPTLRLPFQL